MTWMCSTLEAGFPEGGGTGTVKQQNDANKIISALAVGLEISTASPADKLASAQSFCAYYNNKDVVTSTRVTPLDGGVAEMNAKLFEEWGGADIEGVTPTMKGEDYAA